MKESTYRVLEFEREDLEEIIKNAVSSEFQKMYGMVYNPQSINPKSEFLTREEVGLLLNVSLVTLHNWDKKKVLISRKVGGRVLYVRDDVYAKLN